MEPRKFISRSAHEAVAQIRTELGPNAVVLNVRKIPRRLFRGIRYEITATVKEAEPVIDPIAELRDEIRVMREKLNVCAAGTPFLQTILEQSGLLAPYAQKINSVAQGQCAHLSLREQIDYVGQVLAANWREPQPLQTMRHVFVGTPGSGKSLVLCKWLAQTILSENRGAAVYQLDTHVANLSPQPRLYSEILGAFFSRTIEAEFPTETTFIDLPGIELNDRKALDAAREVIGEFPGVAVHLVVNGAYDANILLEQARFFGALSPADIIVAHLDEESRWGKLWNFIFGTNFCIRYLSLGQNVPGGLLQATSEQLLNAQFRGKSPFSRDFEAGKPSAKQRSEFVGR